MRLSIPRAAAYCWLGVPMLLFLGCWIRPAVGFPLALLLLVALFVALWSDKGIKPAQGFSFATLLVILLLLLVSGIGGYWWQNPDDHLWRNLVGAELLHSPWPVTASESGSPVMLCYYVGFWLLPAAVARLAGGAEWIFNLCQYLYAAAGLWIVARLMFALIGRVSVKSLLLFVFLCGWSAVPLLWQLPGSATPYATAYYAAVGVDLPPYMFTSVPLLLTTVFHQAIAAWMVTLMVIQKPTNILPIGLLILFSPIMALPLTALSLMRLLRAPRPFLSYPNAVALVLAVVMALYYVANPRGAAITLIPFSLSALLTTAIYWLLQVGIFLPLIWSRVKADGTFWTLLIFTILLCFVKAGDDMTFDVTWRCVVPLQLYLALLVAKSAQWHLKGWRPVTRLTVVAVGAFTPLAVLAISLFSEIEVMQGRKQLKAVDPAIPSLFAPSRCHDNFVSPLNPDAIFVKYLMKNC